MTPFVYCLSVLNQAMVSVWMNVFLIFFDLNGFFKITPSLSRFSKPTRAIASRIALAFNVDILQIVSFILIILIIFTE